MTTNRIENDENLGRWLRQAQNSELHVDDDQLVTLVLNRVRHRRRGVRRLVAASSVLILGVFVSGAFCLPLLQRPDSSAQFVEPESQIISRPSESPSMDSESEDRQLEILESKLRLRRLKSELARLERIALDQQKILIREHVGQSLVGQVTCPYPKFIGD